MTYKRIEALAKQEISLFEQKFLSGLITKEKYDAEVRNVKYWKRAMMYIHHRVDIGMQ